MFEFVGNLVSGGWNAVSSITSGIGKGASNLVSSFFPASQKTTTISEITNSRENQGATFRPVKTDASSLFTSGGYVGGGIDPYAGTQVLAQPSFLSKLWSGIKTVALVGPVGALVKSAVTPTVTPATVTPTPTMERASTLANQWLTETETPKVSGFDKMLQDVYGFAEGFATSGEKVTTLADRLLSLGQQFGLVKPRQTTVETPRVGAAEGVDVQHLNNLQDMGAQVLGGIASTADAMMSQLKGLFNLGFSGPEGGQPVFTIAHEIEPSAGTTTGLIIAGVVLLVLFLIFRRRK